MGSVNVTDDKTWVSGLATSMSIEHDYFPAIEGDLPEGLRGTLYRNGPGRFELGGVRKNHLLDGDGMIQAFDFQDGRVRYRNRFVRTEKYLAEQQAQRLFIPTWTTRAPGGMLRNAGHRILSQAGVTTLIKGDCLYAFDEVGLPYGLDPQTLETRGEQAVGPENLHLDYKAHTKTDARTGAWVLLAFEHGPRNHIHLVERDHQGALQQHHRVVAPRASYIHDWFLTERYVLVLLHPIELSLSRYLSGLHSFTDSLSWKPQKGNLLMVVDRSGSMLPQILEAPACFMWHSLNAYEQGAQIIADFIGYDAPDHFIGERAAFRQVMAGKPGLAQHPGTLRRYIIDSAHKRLTEEIICTRNCEFPVSDPRMATQHHRYGYMTTAPAPTVFHSGLARINVNSGQMDVVDMGDRTHLGEPIFAPQPDSPSKSGWLLSLGLDGTSGNSFLGVFRSDALADGPLARIWLTHPTPLSFHGHWHDASTGGI